MASGVLDLGPSVGGGGGGSGNATSIQGIPVIATPPTDGQVLVYVSANGDYEPSTPAGSGDVLGPGTASDNAVTRFNGTTGKSIQNSLASIDDSGNLTANNVAGTFSGTFAGSFSGTHSGASSGTNSGDVTIATFGTVPSNNVITVSGQVLTVQPADATHPGAITSGAQNIGGAKTFSSTITASNLSGTNSGDQVIAMTVPTVLSVAGSPLSGSGTLALSYSGTALPVANGGTGITTGLIEKFGLVLDGGGGTIASGTYAVASMPTAGVITSWVLLADISGSITIDIKKSTYSGYNTMTSITASALPALSSVIKNTDSTLTGWTKSFSAGDVMQFVVSGVTSVTKVTLTVLYTRA